MHIVMQSKSVQTRAHSHKHWEHDAFSHFQSHKWVIICTSTEKRKNPRSPRCSTFPQQPAGAQTAPAAFPHAEEVHCISTAYACKSTGNGIISDTHMKGKKRFV